MCLFPVRCYPRNKDKYTRTLADSVMVKCGKCVECARQYSVEWAFRIVQECKQYERNCFITLTYNEENLPNPAFVSRREVQLFMKRLRQEISPLKIRFFATGEYGKKNKRPHYHLIIFNWFPEDAWLWKREKGVPYYRSSTLEKLWPKGFSMLGDVTYDSALYCAKYMNKLYFDLEFEPINADPEGDEDCPFWDMPTRPFVQMSNRPGIGYNAVYDSDLTSDRIYVQGRSCKIPRYYLKVMERDGIYLDEFKERRRVVGQMRVGQYSDMEKRRESARKIFEKKFIKKS